MAFADLKNDFVFRRIFATHPDILRSLLNDLLERSGDRAIEAPGADLWAWLFVHAPELTEVPADLTPGPYRAALELANKATFTQEELDAYQKVIDEIQQVRELAEAKLAEGEAIGMAKGHKTGKIAALLAILAARGLSVGVEARARIEACDEEATLDRWIVRAVTTSSLGDVFTSPETSAP